MQQLNQIILCSKTKARSFLREVAVFDDFAVVTNIERLPFRYHEMLGKKRSKRDQVVGLDLPIRRTDSHRGCPYCGQQAVFHCRKCGFLSCTDLSKFEHHCPGCDKAYPLRTMRGSHASESGFVDTALVDRSSERKWKDAQSALLDLIEHRNRQDS
ncbi:hypothetical protein TH25_21180 [Thalassospira profundimaris]|uniref:Uncharacterized protein n=1 Tax=Thalassospira profundimaris TaxID=502049 RepID=A0A367WQC0_9PROT|nr:hypothetical protein [Thalassospira profundimaris]RCK43665.1 hypothetical protein TH25_21180 [Thalassospira profundimaris]